MKIDAGGVRPIVTDFAPGRRMEPDGHPGTPVSMWGMPHDVSARLGPLTRPDALRMEFLPGSGRVIQFFFRGDRTPADGPSSGGQIFRRRAGG